VVVAQLRDLGVANRQQLSAGHPVLMVVTRTLPGEHRLGGRSPIGPTCLQQVAVAVGEHSESVRVLPKRSRWCGRAFPHPNLCNRSRGGEGSLETTHYLGVDDPSQSLARISERDVDTDPVVAEFQEGDRPVRVIGKSAGAATGIHDDEGDLVAPTKQDVLPIGITHRRRYGDLPGSSLDRVSDPIR